MMMDTRNTSNSTATSELAPLKQPRFLTSHPMQGLEKGEGLGCKLSAFFMPLPHFRSLLSYNIFTTQRLLSQLLRTSQDILSLLLSWATVPFSTQI